MFCSLNRMNRIRISIAFALLLILVLMSEVFFTLVVAEPNVLNGKHLVVAFVKTVYKQEKEL